MKVDLKTKTLLIVDTGLCTHLAEKLAKTFGTVLYYIPNDQTFPTPNIEQIGTGIKGVTRIFDLYDHIHADPEERTVDCFFFTYIGMAGLQNHLRELGYPVAGAGYSDIVELDRELFLKELKKAGLPVSPYKVVKGISKLRVYLENYDGPMPLHIKISKYRGLMESMKYEGIEDIEPFFDDLACRLGAYKEKLKFIVQEHIKSKCEIGMDSLCLDGKHPEEALQGIEGKDSWFIGRFCKIFDILKSVGEKMEGVYAKLGFNGHHSNEVRITADGEAFPIDETNRVPIPPGAGIPEILEDDNYAQCLWDIADDKMPVFKAKASHVALIIMKSPWYGDKHPLVVRYPKELAPFLRFRNYCIDEGITKIIPNDNDADFCEVIATGKSAEEAMKLCIERAEQVKGYQVYFNSNCLCEAMEAVEQAKKCRMEI
jgi:hypothetical protein